MNKWIYSSISLNFSVFLSLLSIAFFLKPSIEIIFQGGSIAADFIGFEYLPMSFIFCLSLGCLYILEAILYLCLKKYAFSFPYARIKYKFLYYLLFYIGILWGGGFILFITADKCINLYDTLLYSFRHLIINLKLFFSF